MAESRAQRRDRERRERLARKKGGAAAQQPAVAQLTNEDLVRLGVDPGYVDPQMAGLVEVIKSLRMQQPARTAKQLVADMVRQGMEPTLIPMQGELQELAIQIDIAEERYVQGQNAKPQRARPRAKSIFLHPYVLMGGGGLIALIILILIIRALMSGGGANTSSAGGAQPTQGPTAPALPTQGVTISSIPAAFGVDTFNAGSVLLTGTMKLDVQSDNGTPVQFNTATAAGDFNIDGVVIGQVVDIEGGKKLSFNGNAPASVYLIKVDPADPNVAPVTFLLGNRIFKVLAQNTDNQFHLMIGEIDGTWLPPEPIDVGPIRIKMEDAGPTIRMIFPIKAPEPQTTPAPTAPAGNG